MAYTDADLDLRPHVTDEYYEGAPFCGKTICGTNVCAEKTRLHIHTEELAGVTPTRYDYDYLNRLTMINGEEIAEYGNYYDPGKPTKYKGKDLSWDGNKLTSVAKNGIVRAFTYDVRNYLVSAVTDGDTSKFFYDEKGNLLREERTKNGVKYKVNYIYAGGEAIGFTLRGQRKIDLKGVVGHDFPFYYVKDAQGNVRKIVDRMGNCVVKYNYNAWGKETVTTVESTWEFPLELYSDGTVEKFCIASDIAELNRLTYRGYFYNRELGLYYLINRYYDPETGRFISADDAEYLDFQTLYGSNRYIYCLDNPVNYIDPEGTFALSSFLIGLVVTALVTWILSEVLGEQIVGGMSTTVNGASTVCTGISLLGFGPVGWIAGGILILVGACTMLFGVNDIVEGFTGTNYMKNWMGMSDNLYNGLDIGFNIASAICNFAGNSYIEYANVTCTDRGIARTGKPYSRSRILQNGQKKQYRFFDADGNALYDKDFSHGGDGLKFPHYHKWENGNKVRKHLSFRELLRKLMGR